MTYCNVEIKLEEAQSFQEDGYTVKNNNGLIFKASSVWGKSYANDPESALNMAKQQIFDNMP